MSETKHPTKNDTPLRLYSGERSLSIRQWRNDVYEELNDAGMEKVAERWLSCSEECFSRQKPAPDSVLPKNASSVWACADDHTHEVEIYSQTCDLRICPECARRHSARLVDHYLPVMLDLLHSHHPRFMFRHIIFTSPYPLTAPDIREKYISGFRQVESVMVKVMDDDNWKSEQGFLTSAEFGESGLKLHYHVIHYGKYMPQGELVNAWRDATGGDAEVVFVKGFPYRGMSVEESLREVLKYACKFYKKNPLTGQVSCLPADLMPLLFRALEKTRRIRSYGIFYNLPEPDRAAHSCATCGAAMIAIPIGYYVIYCNTGLFPSEWKSQNDPALNLKPADKCSSLTSGLSPPDSAKERALQKELGFLRGIRDTTWD